ncbi:Retrovirus-related Pol polyprotein from transposon TNT 1-94 [Vitis vinifera]|uniref:Retrovirus-related Pol polyprotein from transposon TNT 1-94 n=1 Tax=Vitis vinifera TaxID=29760 RepID=A0A438J052_VITVI|nr:Retrovirus-related Pol polyprotein from transposon TNT 1-94 [Vitis vinifera]
MVDMTYPVKQRPGPFAKYLMECGVVPQYTMPRAPSQNGVAERRNRTLKDMVRSNAKFIEDVELSGREPLRKVVFEEESVNTLEIPPAQVMEPIQVHEEVTQQPQEPQLQVPLRRSTRERRSTISDDYVVYLQEHEFDMGLEDDPISTKRDSKGNIVRYKVRLVAKGFTQKEDIDYKETFSPVSSNDSFRIIMALVAHYDLELHQMDVKTAFLNGSIDETIYMVQPKNIESNNSKQLVITSFGFKENTVDQCIYLKFSGSKFIILVLFVDDILLASSDIYRDRSRGILGLSQKAYIDKVLSRFGMSNCAPGDTPEAKGDKFSLHQCPKNELEKKDMERYLSNPGMDHWKKAKRVMQYLQRTKDYMLTYRRSSHLEIVGYLDSDFMGCLDNRRSTSGYIFMVAGRAVSWKSVK